MQFAKLFGIEPERAVTGFKYIQDGDDNAKARIDLQDTIIKSPLLAVAISKNDVKAAEMLINELEWKILYCKFNPNRPIPKKSPSIKQCIRWIAQLGGFLDRKSDKDPGITPIWRGLKKFIAILESAELASNFVGNR